MTSLQVSQNILKIVARVGRPRIVKVHVIFFAWWAIIHYFNCNNSYSFAVNLCEGVRRVDIRHCIHVICAVKQLLMEL